MIDFSQRTYAEELMDSGDYSKKEFLQCLTELEQINRFTAAYFPLSQFLERVYNLEDYKVKPMRVLDVGFGFGDSLRYLAQWAQKKDYNIEFLGLDLNPECVDLAAAHTDPSLKVQYRRQCALECSKEDSFDVIMNSLFMHHLGDQEIRNFVKWMDQSSTRAWIINDLHRHPLAYYFIKYVTKLVSKNRLIKNDAPLSVARSFSKDDWKKYIGQAGISVDGLKIDWYWSFRILVSKIHAKI